MVCKRGLDRGSVEGIGGHEYRHADDEFDHSELVGGIHFDLGRAMAECLGTHALFMAMPRKRIPLALRDGEGDVACHFLPAWFSGDFDWTTPFMPNALIIVSSAKVKRPATISSLSGSAIGTVLGFSYPDIEKSLGAGLSGMTPRTLRTIWRSLRLADHGIF
jgi:hypothetical protein